MFQSQNFFCNQLKNGIYIFSGYGLLSVVICNVISKHDDMIDLKYACRVM